MITPFSKYNKLRKPLCKRTKRALRSAMEGFEEIEKLTREFCPYNTEAKKNERYVAKADRRAELMARRGISSALVQNIRQSGEQLASWFMLETPLSVLEGLLENPNIQKIQRTVMELDRDIVGGQGVLIVMYGPGGDVYLIRGHLRDLHEDRVRGGKATMPAEQFSELVDALESKGNTVRAAYWGLDLTLNDNGFTSEDERSRKLHHLLADLEGNGGGSFRLQFSELERSIRDLDAFMTGIEYKSDKSLASQLEQLFPNADGAMLESIVTSLDAQIKTLRKTTDKTYTGVVLDFEIDGKRVYCKVGSKAMLAKEVQYAKDAWQHQLMRLITPKSIGLVDAGDMAGLLTYGTENIGIVAPEDFMAYFNMKNRLERKFARHESIDSKVLSKDPIITDMFNRAIAHTYMKEHMVNPIYRTAMLDSVAPIEKLESRLCESTLPKDKIAEIVKLFPLYMRLAEETAEYDKEPTILAHFDPRAENIFPSRLGSRPTGDFGSAKPGTPEFDLGKMEVPNTDFYVQAYAFFRNALEQAEGNNFELSGRDVVELQDKVRKVGFVNALKMACFKSSRGLDPSNYINLSRQYAGLLQ